MDGTVTMTDVGHLENDTAAMVEHLECVDDEGDKSPSPDQEAKPQSTFSIGTSVKAFFDRVVSTLKKFEAPRRPKLLRDLYVENEDAPSPPSFKGKEVEMEMDEVEARIRKMVGIFHYPFILRTLSQEGFEKLAFAVGKGMYFEKETFMALQDMSTSIGKRFDAIYKSDGDDFFEHPKGKEAGWHLEFIKEHMPHFVDEKEESYTIFTDPAHGNLEFFHREQSGGLCHLQAPILLQWYLTLWQDPNLNADNVHMIQLSKYVRNTYSSKVLHRYIVNDTGDDYPPFPLQAIHIMPELFGDWAVQYAHNPTYDILKKRLQDHGPANAELFRLDKAFVDNIMMGKLQDGETQYNFKGNPPANARWPPVALTTTQFNKVWQEMREKHINGHVMLLVGVYRHPGHPKDNGKQVYLLLQNWWEGKPFISMRLDYFMGCRGVITFSNGRKIKPLTEKPYYAKLTKDIRCAATSAYLEKGLRRRWQ